ncbi:PREDICTED: uncharacterized protein At4g08330, chloroplastic-like [Ipomoea nil]|uniref:uncharacterized protein At4g08330, chloroplastic-like n=1 Tax=Ipomoea nil TaxID=35883 RepID=UPI000901BA12|nr:PREDICTED: uncharacterized protein At4g08330, chloroplastic-like [Ipomoea nil]
MSSSSSSASAFTSLIRMNTSTDRDVSYRCGCCGYALNLSSCNRNTSVIGSEYDKAMKRGVISFFCIDETRFTHITKFRCLPYFRSKHSWGLFRRHTKLLCRECGNYIGTLPSSLNPQSQQWDGLSACRSYDINISSLTPSSQD